MRRANERPRLRTEAAVHHGLEQNQSNSTARASDASPPIEELLSMHDLCRILRVSRSKLERLRAAGKVPPPDLDLRTVSKPIPRWRPSTIRGWIEGGGRL
jgi:hypothetical protein